ncbi:MAG: PadR family transcriptional regulator [Omnitrophica WOR_2 bacterium]
MVEKTSDRELKRGTLEMILLKLLSERTMYGYELVSTLEERGGQEFQIKEGTLYPVLYRLENAGFIEPRWETLDRGVPRKYYRLTDQGKGQLTHLIDEWQDFSSAINRILGSEGSK